MSYIVSDGTVMVLSRTESPYVAGQNRTVEVTEVGVNEVGLATKLALPSSALATAIRKLVVEELRQDRAALLARVMVLAPEAVEAVRDALRADDTVERLAGGLPQTLGGGGRNGQREPKDNAELQGNARQRRCGYRA